MMLYSHLAEPSMVYNMSSPSACLEQRNPINHHHHPPPMSAYFHWVVWAMRMTSVPVRRWIEEGWGKKNIISNLNVRSCTILRTMWCDCQGTFNPRFSGNNGKDPLLEGHCVCVSVPPPHTPQIVSLAGPIYALWCINWKVNKMINWGGGGVCVPYSWGMGIRRVGGGELASCS